MTDTKAKIAVIGLGYVGLPLAVEFGKHRPVIGFDIQADRISELREGQDRTRELNASELAEARHLTFSSDQRGLTAATIFIVTVPTPIDAHKRPDLTPLIKASETVGKALKRVTSSSIKAPSIQVLPKKTACRYSRASPV
jgi:UDP-N-acetyl-D-galactosamine dehydrogenase